jgi:competence protein ComEC
MILVAAVVWLGAYCGQEAAGITMRYLAALVSGLVVLCVGLLVANPFARLCSGIVGARGWGGQWLLLCTHIAPTVIVLSAALAASSGASAAWLSIRYADVAYLLADGRQETINATVRVLSPITVSPLQSSRCMADVRVMVVQQRSAAAVASPSSASATLFGEQAVCNMHRDGSYRISVRISRDERRGELQLWSSSQGLENHDIVSKASAPWNTVSHVQQRFLAVTSKLSEQGRVLVPGLTLGVLGQDAVTASGLANDIVDPAYARKVEDDFRRSGIMHLMVVSGGHYVLLAALIQRVLRSLHCHRVIIALARIAGSCALTMAVYPSDSLWRAVCMSVLSALAVMQGRRAQALSQLSWVVVLILFVSPQMSRSYGFALSCAAVLGIASCAETIAAIAQDSIGKALAGQLATTLSAQMFTLPIQLLMDPEIPVLSILANLLVAPAVNIATVCGLLALGIAWLLPDIAYCFAWVSSIGSALMNDSARWLSNAEISTFTWLEGWQGAILMLLTEMLAIAVVVLLHRAYAGHRRLPGQMADAYGMRYRRSIYSSMVFWVRESREIFGL